MFDDQYIHSKYIKLHYSMHPDLFGCKSKLELKKYHLFFTKLSQSINGIDTGILYFPLILPPSFSPSPQKDIKQLLKWHSIKQYICK